MIAHPYRILPPLEGVQKGVPVMMSGVGTLVGGPRPVEIIQKPLIGGEEGKKTILLSLGGGPGFPLMGCLSQSLER